ncbi:MAG: hypothetical protein M0Z53_04175 [Thermaerobacter sp.]|nr:hypothetical protein [Thermaerobacter sp.]
MRVTVKQALISGIAAATTLAALLSADWVYRTSVVRMPLQQAVARIPGVQRAMMPSAGRLSVQIRPSADLMAVSQAVNATAARVLGHAPPALLIEDHPSAQLTALAGQLRFVVAQGEATGQYVAMRRTILREATQAGAQAVVEMGNAHLYLTLHRGPNVLYQILPLPTGGTGRG